MPDGAPLGPGGVGARGTPLAPGQFGSGGQSILAPALFTGGTPVGGPMSRFFGAGAPIAILGGVFSAGLPLAGPVTQVFRGGSAPMPNTLFIATLSPSGPIAAFLVGGGGSPIGVPTFGGGGLPIAAAQAIAPAVAAVQPRTALVGPPAVAFGGGEAVGPAPPVGGAAAAPASGAPIGRSG